MLRGASLCHVPSCPAMYRPACPCPHLPAYTSLTTSACLPTPARPLPYLPPSYQLPTLSILPSCAMACSESVPPTHQQHTSKCQGALPACCQASPYDHKYTEGDCILDIFPYTEYISGLLAISWRLLGGFLEATPVSGSVSESVGNVFRFRR